MRQLRVDDSSNVASATWSDGDVLDVEFKSGTTYRYRNVQQHQFGELASAPSVGKWVTANLVKMPQAHPFEKLPEPKIDERPSEDRLRGALELIASLDERDGEDATARLKRAIELAVEALS